MEAQRQLDRIRWWMGGLAAAALSAFFLTVGAAPVNALEMLRNNGPYLVGPRLLSAAGDTHNDSDTGHLALQGLVVFDHKGGVSFLDVVIQYNDFHDGDGLTCELTSPSDLTYTIGTSGPGSMTLTIGTSDSCVEMSTGNSVNNAGQEIVFDLYALAKGFDSDAGARFVATSSDLTDGNGNSIDTPDIVGALSIR